MSHEQQSYLSNVNRMIIFLLSAAGLFMDGLQSSDILCTVALIVWLWLPTCTRIEAKAINYFSAI